MNVSTLMTSPVVSISSEATLDAAYDILAERRISSVPVLDAQGKAVGVLSLTDLLRIGRLQPASLAGIQPIELPKEPVRDHMHAGVLTVPTEASVTRAARTMVDNHVHRVYVEDEGRLVGVFSIEEVLIALRGLHLETPLGEVMTKPVMTVPVSARISDAISRLDRVGVTGLAILDEHDQPIGMFTQVEALASRDMHPDTSVEHVMSYAVLMQHEKAPLFRAAAHAYEARARRVLVMKDGKLAGLLSGLDFARLLAAAG